MVLTTHHHLVLGLKKRVELYIFSPSGPSWLILGWIFYIEDNSLSQNTSVILIFVVLYIPSCRSQWPRGLRCRSAAACLLRSWVRIPPGAWIFVCCECRALSGRGLCDKLITRPEESYRLCCVVVCDLETSRMGAPHIYDISRVKVNNLTLILLTWRKWWAPNNASK